jgi:pimeloyl-ACP methyl ester carboxylesterase
MEGIRNRVIWLNVNLPGQEPESPDLESKKYPSLEELGEGLVSVLNELKIPQVVCMGQGAGANIAFHFATKHAARCLGLVLIEPIGSSAGFMESIRHMFGARGKSISGESGGVSAEHRAINEHRNSAGSILTRFDKVSFSPSLSFSIFFRLFRFYYTNSKQGIAKVRTRSIWSF